MHRVSIQNIMFRREKMELQVPKAFRHLSHPDFPPLPVEESEHFYFMSPQVVLVAQSEGQGAREVALAGWCKAIALPRVSLLKQYNLPHMVVDTYACPKSNLQYIQPAPDFMTHHLLAHRPGSFWIVDNTQESWLVHVATARSTKTGAAPS